ncbi:MAG: hypothetical protein HN726_04305 [Candidatus Magasanikbacteria bacterium]|jgi:hypothetical protein|nr:hypothetical protein [Candidatus Magasanikbacteria bacterium]MBT4220840.1 hypothetical protein [Candidatus Magasanikbacteria bacterium]MBT4350185.1 hypothetical protein [Candidatus Magasanikbacteria bacterium]MBT4541372.1 hypothetical protein [Candidatus Magasanikbacteria bacterium]MBT6253188.1 hypothetical protein [Candidatus Magasanikbacteria bacterium]
MSNPSDSSSVSLFVYIALGVIVSFVLVLLGLVFFFGKDTIVKEYDSFISNDTDVTPVSREELFTLYTKELTSLREDLDIESDEVGLFRVFEETMFAVRVPRELLDMHFAATVEMQRSKKEEGQLSIIRARMLFLIDALINEASSL